MKVMAEWDRREAIVFVHPHLHKTTSELLPFLSNFSATRRPPQRRQKSRITREKAGGIK
jgi:hypothetical protein